MSDYPLLTVKDVQERLGVSRSTVYRLIRGSQPLLKSFLLKSHTDTCLAPRRVTEEDLRAYIERNRK